VRGICDGAPELNGFVLGQGRRNRVPGASGYEHQIDVSLLSVTKAYLIECKRWESKIGVEEVMTLAARGTDIAQVNEGQMIQAILVSTKGATRGAVALAQFFNVQLEVVRSAHVFGLRIGNQVSVGASSGFRITDRATITVVQNDASGQG
jgi:hypothetical protein